MMNRIKSQIVQCLFLSAWMVSRGFSQAAETGDAKQPPISRDPSDAAACKVHLNKIHEALVEYQRRHKCLPKWLSDLHPEFIDDPKEFICPVVEKSRDFFTWRDGVRGEVFTDPVLPISYGYEFSGAEYALQDGVKTTVQEYKKRQVGQMGLKAAEVPIVRCFAHRPILNLSLGGRVYFSGEDWEENYVDFVQFSDLLPGKLFANQPLSASRQPERLLARDPQLPSYFIDLRSHYTSSLNEDWQPSGIPGNNLVQLPQGRIRLIPVDIEFDVHGLIQLSGKLFAGTFPDKVDGIRVGQKCRKIHFFHGAAYSAKTGEEIGYYQIHYQERPAINAPIIYGKDVLDWWFDPNEPRSEKAQIAWEGVNDAAKAKNRLLRLFHTTWTNSLPDVVVTSLSFGSSKADSAPFLIAVTVE